MRCVNLQGTSYHQAKSYNVAKNAMILVKKRLISLICICIFESNYGLCI